MKPLFLVLVVLVGPVSACKSDGEKRNDGKEVRTEKNSDLMEEFKGAPDWVRKNCRTWLNKPELLCAVGVAQGMDDVSLLQETAAARARGALAEAVSVRVRKLLEDYREQTRAGKTSDSDAHVQAILDNATKQVLQGSMVEESWISPRGSYYVLVSCPQEQVVNGLNGLSQIPPDLRTYVVDKAKAALETLESKLGAQ